MEKETLMLKLPASYFLFTRSATFTVASKRFVTIDHLRENPAADLQFRIFAVLWAIASLFHMAHSSTFDIQLNLALLTLSALYVVFKPSLTSFTVFIALQVFDGLYRMPFTTNHWFFTVLVNLTILYALISLMIKRQSFHIRDGDLLGAFSPVVRVEVIILYFFTAFHKLNAGFFSPETSCATDLLAAQHLDIVIPLTPRIYSLNAYFTVALEFLIPTMLCFKRTRNAGIMAGLLFHGVLAYSTYNAFYDFSSMIFALYFLFCSPGISTMIVTFINKLRSVFRNIVKNFGTTRLVMIILSLIAAAVLLSYFNKNLDNFQSVHLYFFWTLFSMMCISGFIAFVLLYRSPAEKTYSRTWSHWSFFVFPVIVFLNGAAPYLGLKTDSSYAMFANLRTEGGVTNHFIVPAHFQLFDFQKNVVEIISSTDPGFQKLANEKRLLVLFEFRRLTDRRKPSCVEYSLNGKRMTFSASDQSAVDGLGKNNFLLSKLMHFRAFSREEPQPCSH